jgi:t-SNARE complex subunit (syntaxin)
VAYQRSPFLCISPQQEKLLLSRAIYKSRRASVTRWTIFTIVLIYVSVVILLAEV